MSLVLLLHGMPVQAQPAEGEDEGLRLTQEEYDRVIHNNFQGRDPAQACSPTEGPGVVLTGKNDADVYTYLVGQGMTPVQAAAVIGNFKAESGPNIDPDAVNSHSGAFGIAQWLGGRLEALNRFATERSKPRNTLDLQLEYFWYEITETSEKAAYEALKQDGDNLEAATETWARKFERPSEAEIQESLAKRINWARQALAQFGGTTPNPTEPGSDGCSTPGGISTVDGLTFPLQTTKATILNNNPKWCHNRQDNCHHDYNAADIFVPTGTIVIAAKNGVVVYTQNGQAANVVIKGVDNNIYYYTHMGPGTVVVRNGDEILAGQKLGTVGTSADAQGTPPHLHFDILPPPHNVRMSCSGAACTSYPFINVQPGLTKAFEGLP